MTNEEIVAKIKSGEGNKNELLMLLYNQNLSLIHRFIKRYASFIEYNDALQVAFLALYIACDGYEPDKGLFFTYYKYAFMSELRNYTEYPIFLSYRVKQRLITFRKTIEEYQNKYGCEPDNQYISDTMQISIEAVDELQTIRKTLDSMKSLDAQMSDEDLISYGDTIPDPAEPIEDRVLDEIELQQLKEDVQRCLNSLNSKQKISVEDFYLYNKETALTAQKLGITDSMCRTYRQQGLMMLRKGTNKRILSKYMDRYNMNLYKGVGVGSFNLTNTSSTERSVLNILQREEEMLKKYASL